MRKNLYKTYFLFFLLMMSLTTFASVNVNFSVDMTNENVGNIVNVLWVYDLTDPNPNIVGLTKNGNVYSTSIDLDANKTIYYAFINGPFIGVTSKFEYVNDECAYTDQPGARTRSIDLGTNNMDIPTVCFGACSGCSALLEVKFSVDMAILGAELANNVTLYVTKDFSAQPDFMPMEKIEGTTVWESTVNLEENEDYYYVFLNGDPNGQNFSMEDDLEKGFGLANCGTEIAANVFSRTLTTGTSSMDMSTVCYGLCGDCSTNYNVDVSVDMEEVELNGKSAFVKYYVSPFVSGVVELTKNENTNVWGGQIPSPAGIKLAYTFSLGNPETDGVVESLDGTDCGNSIGVDNYRFVEMVDKNISLGKVCYAACSACVDTDTKHIELDSEISIYPNPLSAELNVNITGDNTINYSIQVINTLGAIISSEIFTTSTGRYTTNVNALSNGLYFVKVSTKDGSTTKKFIKK